MSGTALFGDTKLAVDYSKKYAQHPDEQWDCKHCGREFFPYSDAAGNDGVAEPDAVEKARQSLMRGCPGDDCPSHWECQGKTHPKHQ